ncbi:RNA polymerase subunit sigma [Streptomyces sp. G3]|uniref:RNA polymerase subunit sigma n=1 Tax=unclassified Streptomyces TaxID=2593676 RepID=UPI0013CD42E6|nr:MULTISPECIES: RNA polymerase subunit sigma [unclassified Streptomyces]MCM1937502.1 RNA polymerase subunit sigma [Streptomyces sp. G3]NDZ72773.1 RNA polymerase subunit sigma [Streptomyces sp. SID10362]QUW89485.1 ECF RNA polymerase sigma factor SigJ [Streptomyces sp. V17-9]
MSGTGDTTPLAELLDERQHLIDVARWMLGPGPTAEEAVTETYRRWYALSDDERTGISDPRVWLTKSTGAICLARLSAPARRLPGPGEVNAGTGIEPDRALSEEVSDVLLNALDALSPSERAVFVLNDVFAMPPLTVADIVGRTPHECAELAASARRSLRSARTHPVPSHQHDEIVRAVRQACVLNDARHLVSLLSRHAIAFFDGGGKIRALTRPVHGDQHVARTLLTLLAPRPRTVLHLQGANGRTAIVVRHHDQVAAVISFDIADQRVTHVWAVLNPDKLRGWNRPHPPADGHGAVRDV